MTPDALGCVRCARCGVWRPVTATLESTERLADLPVTVRQCADDAVCSRLASVGRGELDAEATR